MRWLGRHGLPLGIMAAYACAAMLTWLVIDSPHESPLQRWRWIPLDSAPVLAVLWVCGQIVLHAHIRGGSLTTRAGWRAFGRRLTDPDRLAGLLVAIIYFGLCLRTFGWWKAHIPYFFPFGQLDVTVAHLERTLHFGIDPWRITHAVLGSPWLTWLIDKAYTYGWALACIGMLVGWSLVAHSRARTRFFVAFVGTWIVVGTVAATLLSTAGPCFYEGVTGDAEFYRALFARLDGIHATHHLMAREYQAGLWEFYVMGPEFNPGISAMPSMHVALPAVLAFSAWGVCRWLGVAYAAVTLVTLVGSVHLGWHYALDGYVSIALAPMVWWLAGKAVAWWAVRFPERS